MTTKSKGRTTDEQAKNVHDTFKKFDIEMELGEAKDGRNAVHIRLQTVKPARMKAIKAFEDDLCYALGVKDVEIQAPIRGTAFIGVKIHKETPAGGFKWKDAVASSEFEESKGGLMVPLGRDEFDSDVIVDIHKLNHILVSGTTGSGKSVLLHTIINSLLGWNGPERLRIILADVKRVEFGMYNSAPHILTPVIMDPKKTILALKWLAREMERRYQVLEETKMRDIAMYHRKVLAPAVEKEADEMTESMPYIVMIIDEISDCMYAYPKEIEAGIVRLSQMSRAVGIHLIISTSRPSIKVLTGMMRANIPTRIALQMSNASDSRAILDASGAEHLKGAGDALLLTSDMSEPTRIQTPSISDDEIREHVEAIIRKYPGEELDEALVPVEQYWSQESGSIFAGESESDDRYQEAVEAVREAGKASTSYLQRKLGVGYSRAAQLIDMLEDNGVIGPADGAKPREVI